MRQDRGMQRVHLRTRYRQILLVIGIALLAASTWWMLNGGDRGTTYAVVLTFTAAALTLAITAFGVPWQAQPDDHAALMATARDLAQDIATREADQLQKFLAETGLPRPADIKFSQPELVHWRTDGGTQTGSLKEIKEFYTGLEHGRLVILGGAGAGKTVLATQLVLDLIAALPSDNPPLGRIITVPLRISLPSFDLPADPGNAQPGEIIALLREWIVSYLFDVHGLHPRTAQTLLSQGWILPVLDGLDEMDTVNGNPARAAAVIRALNYPATGTVGAVVITCRSDRYDQLISEQAGLGRRPVLQDATVVVMQRLTSRQIAAYLSHRFPDPAGKDHVERRWRPVLDYIARNEDSYLAAVLGSPLQLFLAVIAFHDVDTDPSKLIEMASDDLNQFLLRQLIPATTNLHPGPGGRTLSPDDVARWLTTLARQVQTERERRNQIDLSNLWTIVGDRIPRYLGAALQSILALFPMLVFAGFYIYYSHRWLPLDLPSWLAVAVCIFIIACIFWRASRSRVIPYRLDVSRLRTREGWHGLAVGSAIGLIVGLPIGSAVGIAASMLGGDISSQNLVFVPGVYGWSPVLAVGLRSGIALAVGFGLAVGAVSGLRHRPAAIRRPGQLVGQGVTYYFVILISATLISCIAIGITFQFTGTLFFVIHRSNGILYYIIQTSFARVSYLGLIGLIGALLYTANSPWPRYFISTRIAAHRRKLPSRPAAFLDWAYGAGLVRLSGVFAEFRHQELQSYLVAAEEPSVAVRSVPPDSDCPL